MKSTRYTVGLDGVGADGDRPPEQAAMLPRRTSEKRHLFKPHSSTIQELG
jgi:hypothetical protein